MNNDGQNRMMVNNQVNMRLNSSLGGLNSTLKATCRKGEQNETVSETEETSILDCRQPVFSLRIT